MLTIVCSFVVAQFVWKSCGELRNIHISPSKWPTSTAEICKDGESAQNARRQMPESSLVEK